MLYKVIRKKKKSWATAANNKVVLERHCHKTSSFSFDLFQNKKTRYANDRHKRTT